MLSNPYVQLLNPELGQPYVTSNTCIHVYDSYPLKVCGSGGSRIELYRTLVVFHVTIHRLRLIGYPIVSNIECLLMLRVCGEVYSM